MHARYWRRTEFRWIACGVIAAIFTLSFQLSGRILLAADQQTGESIYQTKCAVCHGEKGEGTSTSYPHPLTGDRSVGELTEYISTTMPEDKPGSCIGDEARLVSQFIHESFYSPTAQARNKPARVELSRLTVGQYRNVIADMVARFRPAGQSEERQGLNATYFKSRGMGDSDVVFERIDPIVQFDFQDRSPDAERIKPHEFAIRWQGAVLAPETGEYEFVVRTDHSMQLWVNDLAHPLIDAFVKSGSDTQYRGSIFLVGGRLYPLRLEFLKIKRSANDKKDKEKELPPANAFISLEWKRPSRSVEVIPARCLTAGRPTEVCVVTTAFPPDDRSLGWERATSISKEWDQATTDAAIEVASYAVSRLDVLSGTNRDAPDRVARLKEFCGRFAEFAFRRPLDESQRQSYVDHPFERSSDPEVAVKRSILLTLKSPRFLYREIGTVSDRVNDPYDVASRLAFGMWDSMPDQALLQAAASGELAAREQVKAQAERMSSDNRTKTKLREFLLRWLKVERIPDLSKDQERYPDFDTLVANDLRMSLELSIDDLLASDAADFRQLFLAPTLYLNGRLAKVYKVDLPDNAPFQLVSFDSNQRAGLISHPYLMTTFAYTGSSSPIHRGVFVARSILGRMLRPPPDAVVPVPPKLQPELTTRERVSLQTRPESCQSCHSMINSLGFTFEHFDAIGRFRDQENGRPILATGGYRTRQGSVVEFDGVRDLANFLADSPETQGAFVEQLFHAAIKQPIRAYGSQTKDRLRESFVHSNFNIRQLLAQIVMTSALTTDDKKTHTTEKRD